MDKPLNNGWICEKHSIGYLSKCPTCAFEESNWFELSATIQCKDNDPKKFANQLSDWLEEQGHDWIAMRVSPIKEDDEDEMATD